MSNLGQMSNWRQVAIPLVADPAFTGYRCLVDGAWRVADVKSGLGWVCFSDSPVAPLIGGRSIPRSLSALHAEVEAILWAMECLSSINIREVDMATDCSTALRLLLDPGDWPDFLRLKSRFSLFSLHVILRSLNHRADSIARSYRE